MHLITEHTGALSKAWYIQAHDVIPKPDLTAPDAAVLHRALLDGFSKEGVKPQDLPVIA